MKTTFFDTYSTGWQFSNSADLATEAKSQKSFRELLANVWQGLMIVLTHPGDAPRVWMTNVAGSEPRWNAYDPSTGRRLYAATENEVLAWLEERYLY